jgi:YNFM family putative membrane transporter
VTFYNGPVVDTGGPTWAARGSAAYWRISFALFLAGFATYSLLYCVQPLLPVFADTFNVGAAGSSFALSLTTGFLAFSMLCAGPLSEALGRRGLMFASMCGAAALNLYAALAPNWQLLLIVRALEGFVLGGVPAVAMAYLAEEIHPENLGLAVGLYVGGTAFGGMIGRVGTSVVMGFASWRAALGTISVVDLGAALGFIALLPASRNFTRRPGLNARFHLGAWGGHVRHRGLPFLFLTGSLVVGAFITVYSYAGFRLLAPPYNLSKTEVGLVYTTLLFGGAASSMAGAFADRFGRGPVLIAGIVIAASGLALTLSHALLGLIGGIVVLTIGFFAAHSVASGWVGRMAAGAKGHAASLYLLACYLGSSVMGSLGGWFWEGAGWLGVASFTGVLLALAFAISLHLARLARTVPAAQKECLA